jgi:hypothetical protein
LHSMMRIAEPKVRIHSSPAVSQRTIGSRNTRSSSQLAEARRLDSDEYMSVLGTIPKPATEDYEPRIERGEHESHQERQYRAQQNGSRD